MLDDFITANEAAEILRMSPRQVRRYAEGPTPRLRSKQVGNRVMVLRLDVEELAKEINVTHRPKPTRTDIIPPGELLTLITRKDDEIRHLQEELRRTAMALGQYRAEAEAGKHYLEDKERLQRRLEELENRTQRAEQEAAQLRQELDNARTARPWWKKLFGR